MTRGEAYLDLFRFFCREESPPITFPPDLARLGHLPDRDLEALQDFVADRLHPTLQWLTGIGTIEAVELLVDEAIANSEKAFLEAKVMPRMFTAPINVVALFNDLRKFWDRNTSAGAKIELKARGAFLKLLNKNLRKPAPRGSKQKS